MSAVDLSVVLNPERARRNRRYGLQAIASNNISLMTMFLSHLVLVTGHHQDYHSNGYDPRSRISSLYLAWVMLLLPGFLWIAGTSLPWPALHQFGRAMVLQRRLLLDTTRRGGVRIVLGSSRELLCKNSITKILFYRLRLKVGRARL
jgi:hypothetical protein